MNFPTDRGFYVRTGGHWLPARGVPCDHIDSKKAILLNDMCAVCKSGRVVHVLSGFPFNGVSAPRLVWPLTGNPWGKYLKGALFHDHLCALASSKHCRFVADVLFVEFLELLGANFVVQRAWYRSVRLGSITQKYDFPDYRINLGDYYERIGLPRSLANFYKGLRDIKTGGTHDQG